MDTAPVVEGKVIPVVLAVAVVGSLLYAHREALTAMVGIWSRNPMYSYAFAVPFISAYLLWSIRGRLSALEPGGSWLWGAPILGLGVALHSAGAAGGLVVLKQLAFLVSFVGVVVVLLGPAYVRAAWAAVAYLFLMIPLWDGITESLHQPFQTQSAAIGLTLLQWIGVPAYRENTFIWLPNIQIEVARACSGVNYLVAVVAIGLAVAYGCLRSPWRRFTLVSAAVLIAALSNGLRVALICTLAYYELGSPLHGPFHVLHGLFVAGIGYVALFVGLQLLSRGELRAVDGPREAGVPSLRGLQPAGAVALIVLFCAVGTISLREGRAVALDASLHALPMRFHEWTGVPLPAHAGAKFSWWSSADEQLLRQYSNVAGLKVEVSVWYFQAQREQHEVAGFGSAALHQKATAATINLADGSSLRANLITGAESGKPTLFWYEIDGTVEAGRYSAVLRSTWNGFVHGRGNGAVVMLTVVDPGASGGDSLTSLKDLAAEVHMALGQLLPGRAKTGSSGNLSSGSPEYVESRLCTVGGTEWRHEDRQV
jgi:EpsI family protein